MEKVKLASVDIGHSGTPGSSASEIVCKIFRLSNGRYEAIGRGSMGNNQGYYQENYSYGPWTGRGGSIREAIDKMVSIADDDWKDYMKRAGQKAMYEADDAEDYQGAKRLRQVRDALNKCKDAELIDRIGKMLNV